MGSLLGAFTGGLVYVLVLLDFSTDLGRTARSIGYGSAFFELQARALLDGHLWLPDGSMGIEGFVDDGRTYMYFGPFPALLRIPVLLVTDDFNGHLTVLSMLIAFVVFATMCARLMWLVRRCLVGTAEVTRLDVVLGATLLAAVTGGTSLTFDASLPWAYHEVYLWQSAFVIAAVYWMVRVALEPSPRATGWLGAVALGAVLTRTTGGWGVCIGVVVLALWIRFGRSFEGRRGSWLMVALAGVLPLLVGIAVNVVKFDHAYMFPLTEQVWTEVNQHRREALAANGGQIAGPQFFLTALVNYFSPGGIRFVDYFPWVTFPAQNARAYGGAFVDQTYRTGSITDFMPMFLLLSLASLGVLLRRTKRMAQGLGVRALRAPALATFLMTGGVMGYGYIAYRYTSEFVPALVLGSFIAVWGLLAPLARRSRVLTVAVVGTLVVGTVWSVAAHLAVSVHTAAYTYRGEPLERYLALQNDISGGPGTAFAALISHSDALPTGGSADQIHIRGDCDGLYFNTGDENEPWLAVQERNHVATVLFPDRMRRDEVTLFRVYGNAERSVVLETRRNGRARVRLDNEDGSYYGQFFRPSPHELLRVGMYTDSALGYLEVTSSPGGFVGFLPLQEFNSDWVSRVDPVVDMFGRKRVTDPATGTGIAAAEGLPLPLCERIAADNGIDLD